MPTPYESDDKLFSGTNVSADSQPENAEQGSATGQSTQPEQPRRSAHDVFQEVLRLSAPKPEYDPTRPEEIKRQMKVNRVGQGLKTLGEIFSAAKGANINYRQPDNTNEKLQGKLWDHIDNYNKNLENWKYQDYMHRLKLGMAEVGQINTENEAARQIAQQKYQKQKDDRDFTWKEQQAKKAADQAKDELDWQKKLPFIQHDLLMKREAQKFEGELAKITARLQLNNKNFNLYGDYGNMVANLDDGQMAKLSGIVLNDPAMGKLAQNDINHMKAEMGEGFSPLMQKQLIATYALKIPAARQFLGVAESGSSNNQNGAPSSYRPPYQGPVRHEGQNYVTPASVQSQQSTRSFKDMVNTGDVRAAYELLKTDGYSDEKITKVFEKVGIIQTVARQQPEGQQSANKENVNMATQHNGLPTYDATSRADNILSKYPGIEEELFSKGYIGSRSNKAKAIAKAIAQKENPFGGPDPRRVNELAVQIEKDIERRELLRKFEQLK